MSIHKAESKSQSMVKTRRPTKQELLRLGEVPQYYNGEWHGDDPQGDDVYAECYREDPYQCYHDWPYRVEGVVFHNRDDMLEFAWSLSRNQNRDVWTQTPTGFPQPENWWCEERLTRDGEWNEASAKMLKDIQEGRTNIEPDQPTLKTKVDPPSRAEAQGRRKAYWDPTLKKTVITDEWEDDPVSPVRRRQLEYLKSKGIDPESKEAQLPENQWQNAMKAPNAS